MNHKSGAITSTSLRLVRDADLQTIFAHQTDRASTAMAGVPPRGREDFDAHWKKIRADPAVTLRAIQDGRKLAGYIGSFIRERKREVCYWLGRASWGKGIASRALSLYLKEDKRRPLYARTSKGNLASIRVLEKNGFKLQKEELFQDRTGKEEAGYVFVLKRASSARPA